MESTPPMASTPSPNPSSTPPPPPPPSPPDDGEEGGGGAGDVVWEMFSKSFDQVQSVLDRNRLLIQQVNENHHSRASDDLVKNVALIQELNSNVSKIASLYSDLSSSLSAAVIHHHHQRKRKNKKKKNSAGTATNDGYDEGGKRDMDAAAN